MTRVISSVRVAVVLGGAAASAAMLMVVAVPAAQADTLGTLRLQPTAGTVDDTLSLLTARGCPVGSDVSVARIFGPGFPVQGQNLTGVAPGFTSTRTAFAVESQYTLRDSAALSYPPVTFEGTYRVTVECRNSDKAGSLGNFEAKITFTNPLQWVMASSSAVVKPGPTTSMPAAPTSAPAKPSSAAKPSTAAKPSAAAKPGAPAKPSGAPKPGGSKAPSPQTTASPDAAAPGAAVAAAPTAAGSSSGGSSPLVPGLIGVIVGAILGCAATVAARRTSSPGSRHGAS